MLVTTAVRFLTRRTFIAGLALAALAAPSTSMAQQAEVATGTLRDKPGPVMNRMVFGQFAEHLGIGIYGGIWVGPNSSIPNDAGYRRDVLEALKAIKVPMVRWPGGCFGDEYHWRDGVGPQAERRIKVNTSWGGVNEDNTFGTHEYLGFIERLGASPFISINLGSSAPSEGMEWVEYLTSPVGSTLGDERAANGHAAPVEVTYVGLGNELWGCGGNMTAQQASLETNRYSTFIRPQHGKSLKIAAGPSGGDVAWTETMMQVAGKSFDGLSLHHYTLPRTGNWDDKGPALGFPESEWASTMQHTLEMDDMLTRHSEIMDKYDPKKTKFLAVDEWGTWYDAASPKDPALLQQNSVRDAMVAGLNLNIFARHADRVKLAAIAQMVNVLQAMILTDGPRMLLTPTYWVFDLYKPWQDATTLQIELNSPLYRPSGTVTLPAVSVSAVRDKAGKVHVALVNLDPKRAIPVSMALAGVQAGSVSGRVLTGPAMDSHNTFDRPNAVAPVAFTGANVTNGKLSATLPAKSVVVLSLN